MSTPHEEFEVGHELDRALRAAATGLGQVMERLARRWQDQSRESASRAREEWLAQRDAARQQFMPWTAEGRLEKLDGYTASQKWAAAAAWSSMDPTARIAEQDMAQRIMNQHGEHPSILLQRTDPRTLTPDPNPPAKLLSMNEAFGLAAEHSPSWYTIPEEIRALEEDRQPITPLEEDFHNQWQYYSENGVLPEVAQWEQWANYVGRGDEFAEEKWLTPGGKVDRDARESALAVVWDEGREARTAREISDHEGAMHAAGMGDLDDQLGDPREVAENHSWHAYLTPSRFDAASPEELTKAWKDASTAALTGDVGAKRSAERIATMMRERRGLNPDTFLVQAMAEQAAANTESRRNAEDKLRKTREERAASSTNATPTASAAPTAATSPSTATSTSAAAANSRPGQTAGGPAPGVGPRPADMAAEFYANNLRPVVRRERVIELNNMAAEFYASNLRPGSPGHRYFTDRLGPEFESGPWTLGYAQTGWQNLTNHLRSRGASDEEMVAAGLAEPGKFGVRDVFRDRAMMGIHDHETGELVGFVGRDLSGDERAPKVRNTGETVAFRKGDQVFGLHEAQPGARLVRVEGPFDAMAVTLASEGKAAGVSPMGTQMTDTQAAAINTKANGRVWLANDTDAAGQKATETDFYKLSGMGADVRQVDIPGSDPAEAWKERPALLQQQLADLPQARTAAETVVDRYLASPEANPRGFNELIDSITPYVDRVDRDLLSLRVTELDQARAVRENATATEDVARADNDQVLSHLDRERRTGPAADSPIGDPAAMPAAETGGVEPDPVTGAEEGNDDVERLEVEAAETDRELHAAEGLTDHATARENDAEANLDHAAAAYDRRDEADHERISPDARVARDGSSHGFSQSTKDQVANAPVRRNGVAAKVQRGQGVKQTPGKTLRRR